MKYLNTHIRSHIHGCIHTPRHTQAHTYIHTHTILLQALEDVSEMMVSMGEESKDLESFVEKAQNLDVSYALATLIYKLVQKFKQQRTITQKDDDRRHGGRDARHGDGDKRHGDGRTDHGDGGHVKTKKEECNFSALTIKDDPSRRELKFERPDSHAPLSDHATALIQRENGRFMDIDLTHTDRSVGEGKNSYGPLTGVPLWEEKKHIARKKPRMNDYEQWETQQLRASGVDVGIEVPEEGFTKVTEEEVEIDVVMKEPFFLKGQTSKSVSNFDAMRVLANPEGSLTKAAAVSSILAKERHELREFKEKEGLATGSSSTGFTFDARKNVGLSVGLGKHGSGNKSIQEQRQSLPIYNLRQELLDAIRENQVLIVIGETGSGKTTQLTQYLLEDGYARSKPSPDSDKRQGDNRYGDRARYGDMRDGDNRYGDRARYGDNRYEDRPRYGDTDRRDGGRGGRHDPYEAFGGSNRNRMNRNQLGSNGHSNQQIIGCTQPRRVAASSIAKRVAEEVGCRVGQEVGYTIRFEDVTSSDTVIKYMTDGILLRESIIDPLLKRYSVLILDEAHERTIGTDVLFGLLKNLLKGGEKGSRPDLKLIVTSATLNAEKFSEFFFNAKIFTIPGRTFPVEIFYTKEQETDYIEAALITVLQIHLTEPPGDILLFLTGQEEIEFACSTLQSRMDSLSSQNPPPLIVLPVYSSLPSEMQTLIFDPAPPGSRKCVVATNIAEASLTIDGITFVVDPGVAKVKMFAPKTGIESLTVVPISQANARQRSGRAGRTAPGKCFRLYTEEAFKTEMLPTAVPEIQRTNLANTVLLLKAMGVNDLLHFNFMDPPPVETLVNSLEVLFELGALDDDGLMTRLGRKIAEFPMEPQLGKTILTAIDLNCTDEIITVVSMLQVENIFFRPRERQQVADQRKARFHQKEGDHMTYLEVYKRWTESKFNNAWCYENFVQSRSLRRAQEVRKQLISILDRYKYDVSSCGKETWKVRKAMCAGYFRNSARRDPKEGYRTLIDGQQVHLHPSSSLYQVYSEFIIYHELILTTKEYIR